MGIGKIIEWMAMVLSTILMEKLLIKGNGRMMNLMGKELSSMISQHRSMVLTILLTLVKLLMNG